MLHETYDIPNIPYPKDVSTVWPENTAIHITCHFRFAMKLKESTFKKCHDVCMRASINFTVSQQSFTIENYDYARE